MNTWLSVFLLYQGEALGDDTQESEWNTFQRDTQNTGHALGESGPKDRILEQWKMDVNDDPTGVVVSGDTIYVSGEDGIYALDAATGDGKWSTSLSWVGCPTVVGDKLYVGSTDGFTALDTNSGDVEWQINTGGITRSNVVGNLAFVFDESEKLLAVNRYSGRREWEFGGASYLEAGPAVDGGSVYIGARNGEMYKLDINDGSEKWSSDQSGSVITAPTIANGLVYGGTDLGYVFALDPSIGSIQWEIDLGDQVHSSMAVTDKTVFASSSYGYFYALDAEDGSVRWREDVGDFTSPPAVADGVVYFTSSDSKLFAFDEDSGDKLWTYSDTPIYQGGSGPAIKDGTIYIASGEVYALTEERNEKPTARFNYSPDSPIVNEPVKFVAGDSSDDTRIVSYKWDFGDDGRFDDSGRTIEHSFDTSDDHVVRLKVEDEQGATDTTRQSVTVRQPNETPVASFSVIPDEPVVGNEVTLDAAGSNDPDGTITSYTWNIDGTEKEGEVVTHVFETEGEFTVTLEIQDDEGLTASTQQTISVRRRPISISLTGDRTNVNVGEEAIIILSAVNYLTNSKVTIQLILETPSGVSVTGVNGADEGSGQYTAVFDVKPGGESNILLRLQVNETGHFDITGTAVYQFDTEQDGEIQTETVTVSANPDESDQDSTLQSEDEGSTEGPSTTTPGFTIESTITGIICGLVYNNIRTDEE